MLICEAKDVHISWRRIYTCKDDCNICGARFVCYTTDNLDEIIFVSNIKSTKKKITKYEILKNTHSSYLIRNVKTSSTREVRRELTSWDKEWKTVLLGLKIPEDL